MGKQIIRVFPRRTNATPRDEFVRVGVGPGLFDEADEVHVSVSFTWDLPRAEELARQWEVVARVKIGGPALGQPSEIFKPGQYLGPGHVITSRGCPNRCWFCDVWKREGTKVREQPITEGYILHDDNLLACSAVHIRSVFEMLGQQAKRPRFAGGLEAARLEPWHIQALRNLHPEAIFFAYDEPGDLEPLRDAGAALLRAGFTTTSHRLRCYVLCGHRRDTVAKAEVRMRQALEAGFLPMAMLYRPKNQPPDWRPPRGWQEWAWQWRRAAVSGAIMAGGRLPKNPNQEEMDI